MKHGQSISEIEELVEQEIACNDLHSLKRIKVIKEECNGDGCRSDRLENSCSGLRHGKEMESGDAVCNGRNDQQNCISAGNILAQHWKQGLATIIKQNPDNPDKAYGTVIYCAKSFYLNEPFNVACLANIIQESVLRNVKAELENLTFHCKCNEYDYPQDILKPLSLFEFFQSEDLHSVNTPAISQIKAKIYSKDFTDMITNITGIPIDCSRIEISAARYAKNGYLLCHDDDTADDANSDLSRRIAFIIYLVDDDWCFEDGGLLQLFDGDDVKYSLIPSFGAFCFFEVGHLSLHQVQEVFKRDRLSISGWFHGKKTLLKNTDTPPGEIIECSTKYTDFEGNALSLIINPIYLDCASTEQIAKKFVETSSIDLISFLRPEVYADLVSECTHFSDGWDCLMKGPRTHRWFATLPAILPKTLPKTEILIEMLQSLAFQTYISNLVSLKLAKSQFESRRFSKGCYTLLHDTCFDSSRLDVVFEMSHVEDSLEETNGSGEIIHIYESETLKRDCRVGNVLRLVYRDTGVARFVRYLDQSVGNSQFFEFLVGFNVVEDDDDDQITSDL